MRKILVPTETIKIDIQDVTCYVPYTGTFIRASKGAGGNLLEEDIKNGYKDYVYISEYQYSDGELTETDGGQMLLKDDFDNIYAETDVETVNQLVCDAMAFLGYTIYNYTLIQDY